MVQLIDPQPKDVDKLSRKPPEAFGQAFDMAKREYVCDDRNHIPPLGTLFLMVTIRGKTTLMIDVVWWYHVQRQESRLPG